MYTGKEFNENDKQTIRALITELALRTGGEYQVFILVHVKENYLSLKDEHISKFFMETAVPLEFKNITVLWNDEMVQDMYPKLEKTKAATVHNAQWLSVQMFMQEHRQFEFWTVASDAQRFHRSPCW